jgi:hypothetical protein
VLASQNASLSNKSLVTRWSVDDVYEFEPFGGAHGDLYTEIDISGNFVLKLPDGLCHYMTTLGLAKAFVYSASWTEYWNE